MSTLSNSVLPPPKSWDEFEETALSALKIKWRSPTLTHHGRAGQPQAGVDIYGPNDLGATVGVQCKLTSAEIAPDPGALALKAEQIQPPLHDFYFATSSPTDAVLQAKVRLLSQARVQKGLFPVGIFFWNDLVQELLKDSGELYKHYPQFRPQTEYTSNENVRLLALLTLAYYGSNLNFYIELIFGEIGRMAQEDPRQFTVVTRTISACADSALGPSDSELIRRHLPVLESRVFEASAATEEVYNPWRQPDDLAKEIEAYIRNVEYALDGTPLWAFRTGLILAHWARALFRQDQSPPGIVAKLETALPPLFGSAKVPPDLAKEIDSFDPEYIGAASFPDHLHAVIRERLRFEGEQHATKEPAEA